MLAIGILLVFGGYSVSSYGYVLAKGWNITLRQWFSPLNPYEWPAKGDPPPVPAGKVWPAGAATGGSATAKSGGSGPREPHGGRHPRGGR